METKNIHALLIERKATLQAMAVSLKEKFLGLDAVIDEVTSLMMPWYLFPEAQQRPMIINLWGLTGSGKTALVRAIVEYLQYQKLYTHMDMGEFESDSASWMKNMLTDDLKFFDGKPAIFCLDEFQFARTLDAERRELGKDKLRVVWDLLDSGKIDYVPGHYTSAIFSAEKCLRKLEKAARCGVTVTNGQVDADGLEEFKTVFNGFYFEFENRNKSPEADYFLSRDFTGGLTSLFSDEDITHEILQQRIAVLDLRGLMQLVNEAQRSQPLTQTLDLSGALIFVLGNLDEAYTMSGNLNPDISADDFYEQTTKINLADIKRALRKRFRAEQIARLGNNHVIYTSFNTEHFRELIKRELQRIGAFVQERFGWTTLFDDSIVDVVYLEGVFPAQGTRPVFTTVRNLVESRISSLAVSVLEYQLPVASIAWKFEDETFVYTLRDAGGTILLAISDKARLKLDNLRKSVDPELQAHIAVHEAGHAVLAALTLRIIPTVVVSRTASDAEGFCLVDFPEGPMTRESLQKDIVITLGGYVAERLVFGEQFTSSGVSIDIEEASRLANRAVRQYAMGSDPIHLAVDTSGNEDAFFLSDRYASESIMIIKTCEVEAERLLNRNKLLLLKMAEYLTTNSRMEQEMIEEYVARYGKEEWIARDGFIKRDQYYRFHETLKKQLKSLELEETQADIDSLVSEAKAILSA
jgi:cell division protease FtsH